MKKHITVEKVILFLAAAFAAYNFSLAGGYIEHTHYSIGGLLAGIVVNVSLAIAASRYGSLKGDKRTRQAQIAFAIMICLSPMLVSPVIYYSLPATFLTMGLRVAWAIAWPLVADLAIVLAGAVSGKGLISLSDAASDVQRRSATLQRRSSDAPATLNQGKRRLATLQRDASHPQAKLYRCECGKTFTDRYQYSGHQGQCPTHQLARPVIPVDPAILTKKDKSS